MSDLKKELFLHFDGDSIFRYDFQKEFRGYKRLEVDQMLDQIIKDYEIMFEEIKRLRALLENEQHEQFATRYEFDLLKRRVELLQELVEKKELKAR